MPRTKGSKNKVYSTKKYVDEETNYLYRKIKKTRNSFISYLMIAVVVVAIINLLTIHYLIPKEDSTSTKSLSEAKILLEGAEWDCNNFSIFVDEEYARYMAKKCIWSYCEEREILSKELLPDNAIDNLYYNCLEPMTAFNDEMSKREYYYDMLTNRSNYSQYYPKEIIQCMSNHQDEYSWPVKECTLKKYIIGEG